MINGMMILADSLVLQMLLYRSTLALVLIIGLIDECKPASWSTDGGSARYILDVTLGAQIRVFSEQAASPKVIEPGTGLTY